MWDVLSVAWTFSMRGFAICRLHALTKSLVKLESKNNNRHAPDEEVHGGARRQAPEAASFVSGSLMAPLLGFP